MDELPKEQIFDTIRKYGYRIFEEEYMSAYMMDLFPKEKKLRGLIEQARSAGVYSRLLNIYKSCGDDRGKIRRAAEREVQVLMDDCFLDRQYAAFCVDIFLCLENENTGLTGSVLAQKQECRMAKKAERPKMKIYPNDPCPCGSGRKYKNCCGRIDDPKDSKQENRPKLFQDPWNQTAYEKPRMTRMKSIEAYLRGIEKMDERVRESTGIQETEQKGFPWDYPCGCGNGRSYKNCHGRIPRYLIWGDYPCPCGSGPGAPAMWCWRMWAVAPTI